MASRQKCSPGYQNRCKPVKNYTEGEIWEGLAINESKTNLDSIFKSRDITLPTKVHLVKAMVFPVVMYGCESWTVKKTER